MTPLSSTTSPVVNSHPLRAGRGPEQGVSDVGVAEVGFR